MKEEEEKMRKDKMSELKEQLEKEGEDKRKEIVRENELQLETIKEELQASLDKVSWYKMYMYMYMYMYMKRLTIIVFSACTRLLL